MTISVRGSRIAYVSNAKSATINLPAGATAGDFSVLFVEHGFDVLLTPPAGWELIDDSAGSNVNGAAFKCNLTSAQVSAGAVSIGFKGTYYGTVAIISFVGQLAGIRTLIAARSSTGATSRTLTTDSTPVSGDYAIYFAAGRFNGTVTSGSGSSLQTASNPNSSAALYGGSLGSSGAVSSTFTFSATPTGDFEIIVVVAPAPLSGLHLRAPLVVLESIPEGVPTIRAPLIVVEPLTEHSNTQVRASLVVVEPLTEHANTQLRLALFVIESLHPVPPEGTLSTELFPGSLGSPITLPGLAWSFHKKPEFATINRQSASGVSARTALRQYPIWHFEATFEFLRADVTAEYQSLLGFYLKRQGGFDTFLFKDKDDYLVTNGVQGTADGVTTQFPFKRIMGGFSEKVGQVDIGNTITVYAAVAENGTIPNTPGPYTVTVAHAADFIADGGVTKAGVPMTNVPASPAAGQYSYAAGVYTFNSADHSAAVVITYRYLIHNTAYTVTLPNLLIFTTSPAAGLIISADFQFFFNCKFSDDIADFEEFAEAFWTLQSLPFETVPQ